mmetsp:Transcript_62633/g.145810  ORF Transcript_62633/g.145810 Transcript_62633/m.145810 type:complete len:483 (-) Transcript_62633:74-1522(-)
MTVGLGTNLEKTNFAEFPAGPAVVLTAGATATAAGATTAALTGTAGAATTAAAAAPADVPLAMKQDVEQTAAHMEVCNEPAQDAVAQDTVVRWDAHLDHPTPQADPRLQPAMQDACRGRNCLIGPAVNQFTEACEFISLGSYCAPSYALQLLGLKKFSYPFDWVRSSVDSILHCLDVQFQDFLTYSTTWTQDQYMVFGGTRWGGSFWHHNLEAPITREDMSRRVQRLYGHGEVASSRPRFFVRSVNSTKEINQAIRLRAALRQMLPEAAEVLLLLIVDLQSGSGPLTFDGEESHGILFYQIAEADTCKAMAQGGRGLQHCSEGYAQAIAFAVRYWAGDSEAQLAVRRHPNLAALGSSCEQWDGGDPARELFTPRKFYGQTLDVLPGVHKIQKLTAALQMFNFVLQANVDCSVPLQVECFGKYIDVQLPGGACGGHVLQLFYNNGVLSGLIGMMLADGQLLPIGTAVVAERLKKAPAPAITSH